MIQIDPTYDVILTYSPIIEITGHLFECFDYYLFLRNYYKVGILLIASLPIEQLKIAWESKYIDSFDNVIKDFIFINKTQLDKKTKQIVKFGSKTFVLLTDGNIQSLQYNQLIFSTNHLYGFLCEYDNFHQVSCNKNIVYLMDYRIYGPGLKFFNTINYVKKLPFKHYKKYPIQNLNRGMIYMTYVCRLVTPEVVFEYHQMSKCDSTILVVPFKKFEYENLPGITQVVAPIKDFFNKFDTYIYTPVGRKFDCSPRLLTECFIQKKNVYCSIGYFDPGLQVRYNDCLSNLNSLNLTDGDAIIDIIKKEIRK